MSFSRLLLLAASSKKQISGVRSDKIVVNPRNSRPGTNRDPYEGEVILCFDIDNDNAREKRVCQNLGMRETDKRCDGVIFYSQDDSGDRVICLVEMKSTQLDHVAEQIISTKNHIKTLLQEECGSHCRGQLQHITWKACFYYHGASRDKVASIQNQLLNNGFADIASFTEANNDVGPFLRGEERAKELAKKVRSRR